MAGGSLLALIDDITSVLDDVALLTKTAGGKTAGVLGDDLALNAQQVTGVDPARELPVVWAVAKGSLRNKAVLVPAALLISAVAPWAVTPLLMVGGLFLCYEGVEKLAHRLLHRGEAGATPEPTADAGASVDPAQFERDKVAGAIRTDFILSAEIIAITLGIVATAPIVTRVAVLSAIAVVMTIGVYGVVAGIVKLDDLGLHLSRRTGEGAAARALHALGAGILAAAPWLMKALSVAGTAAMFLVGGGILVHGVPALAHAVEGLVDRWPLLAGVGSSIVVALANALVGIGAGAVALAAVTLLARLRRGAH